MFSSWYIVPETCSINGSKLGEHFESNHRSAFNKQVKVFPPQDLVKKLPPPDLAKEDKSEVHRPLSKIANTKAISVDSIFIDSLEKRLSSKTSDEAKSAVFDTETHKMLLLEYLMANTVHERNGNATALGEMEDLGVSRKPNSEDTSEAEFLDTTRESPEFGDSDVSAAELSDADTLNSSLSLELIDLGCIHSVLREAPRLDIDSGSSDSSEDEDSD